jgi:hypothetical protein
VREINRAAERENESENDLTAADALPTSAKSTVPRAAERENENENDLTAG